METRYIFDLVARITTFLTSKCEFLTKIYDEGNIGSQEKGDRGELVSVVDTQMQDEFVQEFSDFHVASEEKEAEWPPRQKTFLVFDPIDGTHNLLAGLPGFGSMVAVVHAGSVIACVIVRTLEHVATGRGVYSAGLGRGAWQGLDPTDPHSKLRVSGQRDLSKTLLLIEGQSQPAFQDQRVLALIQATRRTRVGMASCISGTSVARGGKSGIGSADLLVALGNKPFDNLPPAFLIEQAGGMVTDLRGRRWSLTNFSSLLFSGGRIHSQALAAMG